MSSITNEMSKAAHSITNSEVDTTKTAKRTTAMTEEMNSLLLEQFDMDNIEPSTNLEFLKSERQKIQDLLEYFHDKVKQMKHSQTRTNRHIELVVARQSPLIALDTHLVTHIASFLNHCDLGALDSCNRWLQNLGEEIWEERSTNLSLYTSSKRKDRDAPPPSFRNEMLRYDFSCRAAHKFESLAERHRWENEDTCQGCRRYPDLRTYDDDGCRATFVRISHVKSTSGSERSDDSLWQGFVTGSSSSSGNRRQGTSFYLPCERYKRMGIHNPMKWGAMNELLQFLEAHHGGTIDDRIREFAENLRITVIFVPQEQQTYRSSKKLIPPRLLISAFRYESHHQSDILNAVRRTNVLSIMLKPEAVMSHPDPYHRPLERRNFLVLRIENEDNAPPEFIDMLITTAPDEDESSSDDDLHGCF
jgi:hypothetical protein